jgi:hypothetical protein
LHPQAGLRVLHRLLEGLGVDSARGVLAPQPGKCSCVDQNVCSTPRPPPPKRTLRVSGLHDREASVLDDDLTVPVRVRVRHEQVRASILSLVFATPDDEASRAIGAAALAAKLQRLVLGDLHHPRNGHDAEVDQLPAQMQRCAQIAAHPRFRISVLTGTRHHTLFQAVAGRSSLQLDRLP